MTSLSHLLCVCLVYITTLSWARLLEWVLCVCPCVCCPCVCVRASVCVNMHTPECVQACVRACVCAAKPKSILVGMGEGLDSWDDIIIHDVISAG